MPMPSVTTRCLMRTGKNEFLGRPMRAEGFANRVLQVAWGVLTHDLWVIAEKLREQRKIRSKT